MAKGRLKSLFRDGIGGRLKELLGQGELVGFVLQKVKPAMYLSFTSDGVAGIYQRNISQ